MYVFGKQHFRQNGFGRSFRILAAVAAVLILLASCVPGASGLRGAKNDAGETAGFWRGLWHGVITPVTFIVSLFNPKVNVYEARNNGGWYNFGYVLGLSIIFGGGGHGARGRRKRFD